MCTRITYYFPEPLPARIIFLFLSIWRMEKGCLIIFVCVSLCVYLFTFPLLKITFSIYCSFFFLLSCLSFLICLLEHLVLEIWILCVMCVTYVFIQSTICLYSLFMTFFSCTNFELLSSWICHTLSYGIKVSSIA